MTPGQRLRNPDAWPHALAIEGDVFFRHAGGDAFFYWLPHLAETMRDRWQARAETDALANAYARDLTAAIEAAAPYQIEDEDEEEIEE